MKLIDILFVSNYKLVSHYGKFASMEKCAASIAVSSGISFMGCWILLTKTVSVPVVIFPTLLVYILLIRRYSSRPRLNRLLNKYRGVGKYYGFLYYVCSITFGVGIGFLYQEYLLLPK